MRTERMTAEMVAAGRGLALRREEPARRRRGPGPGLEQWLLSLMREVGHEPRLPREVPPANVALHDLVW